MAAAVPRYMLIVIAAGFEYFITPPVYHQHGIVFVFFNVGKLPEVVYAVAIGRNGFGDVNNNLCRQYNNVERARSLAAGVVGKCIQHGRGTGRKGTARGMCALYRHAATTRNAFWFFPCHIGLATFIRLYGYRLRACRYHRALARRNAYLKSTG